MLKREMGNLKKNNGEMRLKRNRDLKHCKKPGMGYIL